MPFPSPGDVPDPGIKLVSSALAGRFFTIEPPGSLAIELLPTTIMEVCTFAPAHMHKLLTSLEGKSPGLGAPAVQDGWMEAQRL